MVFTHMGKIRYTIRKPDFFCCLLATTLTFENVKPFTSHSYRQTCRGCNSLLQLEYGFQTFASRHNHIAYKVILHNELIQIYVL